MFNNARSAKMTARNQDGMTRWLCGWCFATQETQRLVVGFVGAVEVVVIDADIGGGCLVFDFWVDIGFLGLKLCWLEVSVWVWGTDGCVCFHFCHKEGGGPSGLVLL